MSNNRPPVDPDMLFRDFLASRPFPVNTWGDYVRTALTAGTLPEFTSWAHLRTFVENYRDMDLRSTDARASWRAYQTMLRTAERRRAPQLMLGSDSVQGIAAP